HKILGSSAVGRITGASPRAGFVGDPDAGLFYHPTIADGVQPDDALFRQETFGPIVGVTTYTGFDEAITLANAPGYGLSPSIYSHNPPQGVCFRPRVIAGVP